MKRRLTEGRNDEETGRTKRDYEGRAEKMAGGERAGGEEKG